MRKLLLSTLLISLVSLIPTSLLAQDLGGIFGPPGQIRTSTFANLGTPVNSSVRYCSNCTQATPCASGGAGAFATRIAGVWSCTAGGAGGSGASTALDNLASVAINTTLLPGADNSISLGASNKRFVSIIFPSTAGAAPLKFFDSTTGDLNSIGYTDSLGPTFYDDNAAKTLSLNLQALSANRTLVVPDAAGTFALTANKLSVFAATSSAELAGVISNESGSGSLIFGTSPTMTGVTSTFGSANSGTCTLNGAATATCTATVPATCTAPICSYNSDSIPHTIACKTTGTTLTAISLTTLDGGVVNWWCP